MRENAVLIRRLDKLRAQVHKAVCSKHPPHLRVGNRLRKTRKGRVTAHFALHQVLRLFERQEKPNQKRLEEVLSKLREVSPLNVNENPELTLMRMHRVGAVIADRIAEERARRKFRSLEELRERVKGIGPKTIDRVPTRRPGHPPQSR